MGDFLTESLQGKNMVAWKLGKLIAADRISNP